MTSLLGSMSSTNAPRGRLWAAVLLVLALGTMAGALFLALDREASPAADPQPAPPSPSGIAEASAVPVDPPLAGLTVDGAPLVAGQGGDLSALVGRSVQGTAVTVESVAADEGFWVGSDEADRVWVQLVGDGESPFTVSNGDRFDLAGQMVAHGPEYARQVGVGRGEGADLLTRQAAHLEVQQAELRPSR